MARVAPCLAFERNRASWSSCSSITWAYRPTQRALATGRIAHTIDTEVDEGSLAYGLRLSATKKHFTIAMVCNDGNTESVYNRMHRKQDFD